MTENKQRISIKGTRDGLTIFISDVCSFDSALEELKEKIKASQPLQDEPIVPVTIKLGNRYLNQNEKEQLIQLLVRDNRFRIQLFDSNLIERDEAIQWLENSEIKSFVRIVRSGQVLSTTGDMLLIGDVNPGGKVEATGNIYILGQMNGTAHAGINGNREAIIAASYMKPTQLRIADYISRAPDYEAEGVYMECGYIDEAEDKIRIDRIASVSHRIKTLSGFERRMQNG
ncbi:septum site-determining protein MinC [Ornithinibacillus gellani]|uniref:septum site-determining protein MinC n=1 Tax=Ornithinibacillus gellani TaxID=2293253 RepID=UPI000F4AD573|nr:septum site-determining protein MinC [Ornithinibacillus gellani]TQS74683.1 septum site-determining protein MinC [Ornithinibacillus gellani]